MKTGLYADDATVGAVTKAINAHGVTCLHAHRLADNEDAHVAELLKFFDPATDSRILDLGCGTGAVADIMKKQRPDLKFVLLNHSQAQLDMANNKHFKICADFHDIPRLPANVDAVMMLYALGHSKLRVIMSEVSRVLPIGGVFFMYDLTSPRGASTLRDKLHYIAYPPVQIVRAAFDYGMVLTKQKRPLTVLTDHMRPFLDAIEFDHLFSDASPTLMRFCKVQ